LRNRFTSLASSESAEVPAAAPTLRRKATLADVAERAGVSTSTASRALNGHAGLAPATRAAVEDAAASLNFKPSALARSLRTRQTYTVGLVVPDVSAPFYAAALKGAQGRLEQAGYRVMLMDANQDVDRELAALETLLSHQVDGLLVATTGMSRAVFDATVTPRATPTIFFDGVIDDTGDGAVLLDNGRGIELLVEHLVEHGHERIAVLAGSQRESAGAARLRAFRAAMETHASPPEERFVKICEWAIADGRRAGAELLADPDPATAVLASSAELALGFMAAAADRGARIPEDIALVAFDDPYFGELLEPPLTAVAYDSRLIGATAADLLVDAMRSGVASRELRIPVTLVRRRSCGCAERANS
jgi:DNA-binding LacI/PurR family transcriptional regulator